MRINLILLLINLFLIGCQASGGDEAEVISDHIPTVFKFTVSTPLNRTYIAGQNIDIILTFPKSVTVTGSPELNLKIGNDNKVAAYLSGNQTNSLKFRYTVNVGDHDTDGIGILNSIDLNGGSLTYEKTPEIIEDCPLSLTIPSLSTVKVDTTTPNLTSVTAPPDSTYYLAGKLIFTAVFSENVFVTGTPRLALNVGGATKYATYLSGSHTNTLIFRYVVGSSDVDSDGIIIAPSIDLNGGTISDGGNAASISFSPPDTSGVIIAGGNPIATAVKVPSNAAYIAGQNLDFTLTFNKSVFITGLPRLTLTIGGVTRYATYLLGSGSAQIKFRYTVTGSDLDDDGINASDTIDLNGGAIRDAASNNAMLTWSVPTLSGVLVLNPGAFITSVNAPTSGNYSSGQNLDFTVNWSVPTIVTGTPRIFLTIGSFPRSAIYVSGSGTSSHVFRYTIAGNDEDTNGITVISPIDLNSGTITNGVGNNAVLTFTPPDTSGVNVGDSAAAISSVTAPANGVYKTSTNVDFIVNYSRAVNVTGTPKLSITAGSTTVYADYYSGSGTSALTFRYTVQAGHSDDNGIAIAPPVILSGGSITDTGGSNAGLSFTSPNTSGILIDGIDVQILSITPPTDKTYRIGDQLNFTVNFNYPAAVTGSPRIQLTVGSATLYANYVSGSGTAAHIYRYTVSQGDVDTDGLSSMNNIGMNGGTIKDVFGDNANVTFSGTNYPGKKVDGVRPIILSTVASSNKTYIVNENIDFTLAYSEAVNISGNPRLVLTVGATTRYATYQSGTGTNAIIFRYTVQAGDLDTNGIAIANSNNIDLNGGTISDVVGNAQTNFTITPTVLTGILVDAIVPNITSITSPTAYHGIASNINFIVTFDETVTVTGTPVLNINVGGATKSASYISGSGSSSLIFRYTTVLSDDDSDGVATVSPLNLSGGTIKDASGNTASLTFTDATLSGVQVDALPPVISSITLPADAAYKNTTMSFTVEFSEPVNITGNPRLVLNVGGSTQYAIYDTGSGPTNIVFNYTPSGTVLDLDGIAFGNSNNLDLNGGTIKDERQNNASLGLGTNDMSNIFVVLPKMASWYDINDILHITTTGTSITGIQDKIGTNNLTHSSTGGTYNSSGFGSNNRASVTCNTSASFNSPSMDSPVAVVSVFQSPATGSTNQQLFSLGNTNSRPAIIFSSNTNHGTIDFGGVNGSHYKNNSWGSSAQTQTNVWLPNTIMARAFSLASIQNRSHNICKFSGQLSELIMFNSLPDLSEMNAIQTYINTKYGLSFP